MKQISIKGGLENVLIFVIRSRKLNDTNSFS